MFGKVVLCLLVIQLIISEIYGDDKCLTKCYNDVKRAANSLPRGTSSGVTFNNNDIQFDPTVQNVKTFCPKIYQPYKNCIKDCGSSSGRARLYAYLEPSKYCCDTNPDYKSWECYERVNKTTGCFADNQASDKSLGAECQRGKDVFECQRSIIEDQCEEKGLKFARGFGLAQLKGIESFIQQNKQTWPSQCKRAKETYEES